MFIKGGTFIPDSRVMLCFHEKIASNKKKVFDFAKEDKKWTKNQ